MKKILITGAAGFIGSNFVRKISTEASIKNEFQFVLLDALTYAGKLSNIQTYLNSHSHLLFIQMDIRHQKDIKELFEREQFDGVIHFAAESHVDRSIENPNIFVETNVLGTLNLLNASLNLFKSNRNFRFVQISTDEVYGSLSMSDDPFIEKGPLKPNSPYSASKASADLLCRAYHETYQFPVMITRCSNNYGPHQYPEKFIPVVIKSALENKPIPIYGNGMNIRDWIHVDDHNRGVWSVFTNGIPGQIYNLGGATEVSNIELAKKILNITNRPESLLSYVPDRLGHDFRYAINFTKATEELNWRPSISFMEGLSEVVSHYQSLFQN